MRIQIVIQNDHPQSRHLDSGRPIRLQNPVHDGASQERYVEIISEDRLICMCPIDELRRAVAALSSGATP